MNEPLNNVLQKPTNQMPNNKAKIKIRTSKKSLLLIVLAVAVIVIIFFLFNNGNGNYISPSGGGSENLVTKEDIDTGTSWGDEYAYYIQTIFDEVELINVTFVDFIFDETPEMIVKYSDDKNEISKLVYLHNNKPVESKLFYNASYEILYSYSNKETLWYIFIPIEKQFGAYTEIERVMNDTAFDSDIKITNNSEKKKFNSNYLVSDYELLFYDVNKTSFVKDFKNVVNNYKSNNLKINSAIEALKSKAEDDGQPQDATYVQVGSYMLKFGTYVNAQSVDIILESNMVAIGKDKYNYTVDSNGALILKNMATKDLKIVVVANNQFIYNELTYNLS